jgi:hypothetical protein
MQKTTGRHAATETTYLYGPTGQIDTISIEAGSPVAMIDRSDSIPTTRVIGPELTAYVAGRLASGWSLV